MKICRKCSEEKPLSGFDKHSKMADGHLNSCSECISLYAKERYSRKKSEIHEKQKSYVKTEEGYAAKKRASDKYYAKNKATVKAKAKAHTKRRMKEDPSFRVRSNIRRRLREIFDGKQKPETTRKLIGCTWPELKSHLESMFTEGMNWDNYGIHGWHVDHIIPLCLYKDFEMDRANHYTNLQPLWAKDNYAKGKKV